MPKPPLMVIDMEAEDAFKVPMPAKPAKKVRKKPPLMAVEGLDAARPGRPAMPEEPAVPTMPEELRGNYPRGKPALGLYESERTGFLQKVTGLPPNLLNPAIAEGMRRASFGAPGGQPGMRAVAGAAEGFTRPGLAAAGELPLVGQEIRKRFPGGRLGLVPLMEETGLLHEATVIDNVFQKAGETAGFLAALGPASAAFRAAKVGATMANALALAGASVFEMRSQQAALTEQMGGEVGRWKGRGSPMDYATTLAMTAVAIPGGVGVDRALKKLFKSRLEEEARKTLASGATMGLFEAVGGVVAGEDPKTVGENVLGGFLGGMLGHGYNTWFEGKFRPRTRAAQERAMDVTADLILESEPWRKSMPVLRPDQLGRDIKYTPEWIPVQEVPGVHLTYKTEAGAKYGMRKAEKLFPEQRFRVKKQGVAWIVEAKLILTDQLMKRGADERAARLADNPQQTPEQED